MSRVVTLKFRGETYIVPETKAFALGAEVEEVVTLAEIASWGQRPKFFKIARAFGVMLRFAGCKVSDAEVKAEIDASMMRAVSEGSSKTDIEQMFAITAVEQLQAVLFNDAPTGGGGDVPEKDTAS
jgi:hypothetical protein